MIGLDLTVSWNKKSNLVLHARSIRKSGAYGARGAATLTGVTTRGFALGHRLAHQLEGTLLGNEAERTEVLDGLLASGVLLAANNASVVLHEVFLGEASRGVLRSSVKYLGFGSNSRHHGSICRRDYLCKRTQPKLGSR